jgi:biotin operon repressor
LLNTSSSELDLHALIDNLGIGDLTEWEVLAFLYRHGTSLASAEQLGQMIGIGSDAIRDAIDLLTSAGLIVRSSSARGVRLYRLATAIENDTRQHSLDELMKLSGDRRSRLLLLKCLRERTAGKQLRGRSGWHLA